MAAQLDWDDLRCFLAMGEETTLRSAAGALKVSHSTLLRRLHALEAQLGARLYDRQPRGFALTEEGRTLLGALLRAQDAIDDGVRKIIGKDERLEGPIRLSVPDFLAFYCLLEPLRAFQDAHPAIDLHVDITYEAADLTRREADIAVRMTLLDDNPPEGLVGRKVLQSAATGYATPAYLERYDLSDPLGGAVWLGWKSGAPQRWIAETPYAHLPARGAYNHAELQHHAALAELGMAYIPTVIGDSDKRLVRAPNMTPKPARDIWVLTHADLRETSRMRRTPLGKDQVLIGPYATLLPVDPGSTDWPDLSELAENGLALLVPTGQMPAAMPKARLEMEPYGHGALVERFNHLFGHKMGVELPDLLTIALEDPAVSLTDALSAEGLGDLDLDDVAVLACPLWAIPATDRAEVTRLCKHP